MRVGDLVTSRWHPIIGIVLDIGYNNGEYWADVHWIDYCVIDNIQFVDDLEVICE